MDVFVFTPVVLDLVRPELLRESTLALAARHLPPLEVAHRVVDVHEEGDGQRNEHELPKLVLFQGVKRNDDLHAPRRTACNCVAGHEA